MNWKISYSKNLLKKLCRHSIKVSQSNLKIVTLKIKRSNKTCHQCHNLTHFLFKQPNVWWVKNHNVHRKTIGYNSDINNYCFLDINIIIFMLSLNLANVIKRDGRKKQTIWLVLNLGQLMLHTIHQHMSHCCTFFTEFCEEMLTKNWVHIKFQSKKIIPQEI